MRAVHGTLVALAAGAFVLVFLAFLAGQGDAAPPRARTVTRTTAMSLPDGGRCEMACVWVASKPVSPAGPLNYGPPGGGGRGSIMRSE